MTETVYRKLMAEEGSGETFDRHLFACAIAVVRGDPAQPREGGAGHPSLTRALGLSPDALCDLFQAYFPHALDFLPWMGARDDSDDDAAIEEEDLRDLLLAHRACGRPEELWLARIVARRSMADNHLWQDLGLANRDELNRLMGENFPSLKALNADNMKWKKFFYRTLCETAGVVICKSPNCETCDDYALCFGDEAGSPLLPGLRPDRVATR
jgi:nitrogen fixation protein NifQ